MGIQVIKDAHSAEIYLREILSEGTTLACLVSARTDFSLGVFRLPMPDTVDQTKTLDFKSGNVRLAKDEEQTFARVVKWFIRNPKYAVVMQELEAQISDPILQKLKYRRLIAEYGTELYWRVSGTDLAQLSEDEILDIMNSASYLPWTGFFYRDGLAATATRLNHSDLEYIAATLVGIAVGALDYRSFLIWWRDDLCAFEPDVG